MNENSEKYHNSMGFKEIFSNLSKHNLNKIDCNFQLKCDGDSQVVHKCLLRAISTKIDQLCSEEFGTVGTESFYLGNVSPSALRSFVNYIYASEITITETNAAELVHIGNLLNVKFVYDAAINFLISRLSNENCIRFLKYSKCYNDKKLTGDCVNYAARHFEEIIQHSQIWDLTIDELLLVLNDDELLIRSEQNLMEFIWKWIMHDYDSRKGYADKLAEQIKFGLIDVKQLLDMLEIDGDKLFQRKINETLLELGKIAKQCSIVKWDRKSPCSLYGTENHTTQESLEDVAFNEHRSCLFQNDTNIKDPVIICFGGRLSEKRFTMDITCFELSEMKSCLHHSLGCCREFSDHYLASKENEYSINDQDNFLCDAPTFPCLNRVMIPNLDYMPRIRRGFGAGTIENKIYLVGGRPQSSMQTVDLHEMSISRWSDAPLLNVGRSWHSVVECEGALYAMGGTDKNGKALNSVEFLDPRSNKWQILPSMSEPRFGFGACTENKHIIVVGGMLNRGVEVFDSVGGKWYSMRSLDEVREAAGVIVHERQLYVFGGANASGCVDTTNILSLNGNFWLMGNPMILPRAFAATKLWNRHVILIGGRNNTESSSFIQTYDLDTNEWAVVPHRLPKPRSSCCVVLTEHFHSM